MPTDFTPSQLTLVRHPLPFTRFLLIAAIGAAVLAGGWVFGIVASSAGAAIGAFTLWQAIRREKPPQHPVTFDARGLHIADQTWPLERVGWAMAEAGTLTVLDIDGGILWTAQYDDEQEVTAVAEAICATRPSHSEILESREQKARIQQAAGALRDRS